MKFFGYISMTREGYREVSQIPRDRLTLLGSLFDLWVTLSQRGQRGNDVDAH